jgi:hypothetical protein
MWSGSDFDCIVAWDVWSLYLPATNECEKNWWVENCFYLRCSISVLHLIQFFFTLAGLFCNSVAIIYDIILTLSVFGYVCVFVCVVLFVCLFGVFFYFLLCLLSNFCAAVPTHFKEIRPLKDFSNSVTLNSPNVSMREGNIWFELKLLAWGDAAGWSDVSGIARLWSS